MEDEGFVGEKTSKYAARKLGPHDYEMQLSAGVMALYVSE